MKMYYCKLGNKTYHNSLAVALINEKEKKVMYKYPSNASRQQLKIGMSILSEQIFKKNEGFSHLVYQVKRKLFAM